MGFLIGLALKLGVSQRWARPVTIAALVALLVFGLGVAKCAYDRSVINNYTNAAKAKAAAADRKADAKAAVERRTDDARITNEAQELKDVEARHEKESAATRRVARQRCIRLQQQARDAGKQSPACP
jgi:hypothetical protein